MTHLVLIGPQLLQPYQPNIYEAGPLVFREARTDPLVSELYRATLRSARVSGIDVSFPIAHELATRRAAWVDAVGRLARADAVLAVFAGQSQAIPIEASLARQMGLRLVVAAVDRYFVEPFERQGVPVVDARRGASSAVRQAISILAGPETAPGAPAF